jgi:lipopolysaccharide transport system permease protein
VISVIVSSFLSQSIGFGFLLFGLAVWQGGLSLLALGLLVVPFVLQLMLAVALGLLLSTANVFFRDVSQLAGAAFSVWFFLTPVLYPASMVPEALRAVLAWNPQVAILALYRNVILSPQRIEWGGALYVLLVSCLLLWVAQWAFQQCKGYFADYL